MHSTRAYKTELDLNNVQASACKRHAGAARFAYNFGLARKQAVNRATGQSPSAIDLHRELNTLKKTELVWMYAVSKCAPQEALRNLDSAFSHFFRRCRLKKEGKLNGKVGYPKPKTRKKGLGSFRLIGRIVVFPDAIQLPRLGRLRLKEHTYLPVTGVKVLSIRGTGGRQGLGGACLGRDVHDVAAGGGLCATDVIVVAAVQAQVLRPLLRAVRLLGRACDDHSVLRR